MAFLKSIPSDKSDATLVDEYQSGGDLQVLGKLYERYMDLVYGVCLRYLKEPEEAKDAVIRIFEELVIKLKKHKVSFFKSWLYQLSVNHCLMLIRSSKTKPVKTEVEFMHLAENDHLDIVLEKEQHFEQMESCLEQLTAEQKGAIEMFYLQEKCYKEIAEITRKNVEKVRSYIQNGRRNLKICMEKEQEKNKI